ncbi:hypothetical protein [Mesorhizobium opportunistum]|uniref:Uncharacterized protein n=1 Tax=Mesorhizobium opportunistum (strain LMG 24607 / HAMBI 3007 / WSM2075) TaxID=536019 RepID=F7YFH1_MESOW|nr:hypothetical protein [Mesorhizobium opportunistum]AEH85716.1 conserved hypothetical protein [Mesorhizobium opportunistum WSM2075]
MAKWSDPAGPDYATDEPEFMVEYGRAMAEWGNVEHLLARIYVKLLKPANIEHATLAFFSVQNLRDRMNMISSLVASQFGEPKVADVPPVVEWERIRNAFNRTVKNRNTLAHMHVWHGPSIGTFGHGHIYQVAKLPVDVGERRQQVVTTKRLRDFREGFCLLWKRLHLFYEAF